ncbi:MAG: NADH-quinone oxidoreductase subunit C [Candidatus Aminicenantes bacterium]|nr:NADH-quinone oxidoreductase subunit C [Candidatus Aminicenantes bacterium]
MEETAILDALKERFPKGVVEASVPLGDATVVIRRDALLAIIPFLKEKPYEFAVLLDLTCVDYPERAERFEMVYHLFSLVTNKRLRIKLSVPESAAVVDSLVRFWKNADWLEREVFDMFGVRFAGHPNLRRLFMNDDFEGHPLRKDYPLRKRQPMIQLRK